jgi:hypothetical protein
MASEQGVLRVVAADAEHSDPDHFEYPGDLPHLSDEPIWGVWEYITADPEDEDGDEDHWEEVAYGLTLREAEDY